MYPVIIADPKFLKKGSREWLWSLAESDLVIKNCTRYNSLEEFLKKFLKQSEFSEELCNDVADWTYPEFICSALTFQFSNIEIPVFCWSLITNMLMNSFISTDVLVFLKKNRFYNPAIKSKIIDGIRFTFQYPRFLYKDERCLRNLLEFVETNENDITRLIEAFSVKKDLGIIKLYFFFLIPNRIEIESIIVYLEENIRIRENRESLKRTRKIPPQFLKVKPKIPFHILLLNRVLVVGAMGLVLLSDFLNPLASIISHTKKLNSYKGVPYTMIIEGPMTAMIPNLSPASKDVLSHPTRTLSNTSITPADPKPAKDHSNYKVTSFSDDSGSLENSQTTSPRANQLSENPNENSESLSREKSESRIDQLLRVGTAEQIEAVIALYRETETNPIGKVGKLILNLLKKGFPLESREVVNKEAAKGFLRAESQDSVGFMDPSISRQELVQGSTETPTLSEVQVPSEKQESLSSSPSWLGQQLENDLPSLTELLSQKGPKEGWIQGNSKNLNRVNDGIGGLNNAYSVTADYSQKKQINDACKAKNIESQPLDHLTPSAAHSAQNTDYGRGTAVATPESFHETMTRERAQKEAREAAGLRTDKFGIQYNSTLYDLLYRREALDIYIVKNLLANLLPHYGLTVQDAVFSLSYGYHLETLQIRKLELKEGLGGTEKLILYRATNVSFSTIDSAKRLSTIAVEKTPEQLAHPKFLDKLYNALNKCRDAKLFNESLRNLYKGDPSNEIVAALREVYNFHELRRALKVLSQKGVFPLSHHPQFRNDSQVNLLDHFCVQVIGYEGNYPMAFTDSELLQSKEELDYLSQRLNADVVYKGRACYIQSANQLEHFNSFGIFQTPDAMSYLDYFRNDESSPVALEEQVNTADSEEQVNTADSESLEQSDTSATSKKKSPSRRRRSPKSVSRRKSSSPSPSRSGSSSRRSARSKSSLHKGHKVKNKSLRIKGIYDRVPTTQISEAPIVPNSSNSEST